jgi:hypothetical protein
MIKTPFLPHAVSTTRAKELRGGVMWRFRPVLQMPPDWRQGNNIQNKLHDIPRCMIPKVGNLVKSPGGPILTKFPPGKRAEFRDSDGEKMGLDNGVDIAIILSEQLNSLIKSGGGIGPMKPGNLCILRKVPIPAVKDIER